MAVSFLECQVCELAYHGDSRSCHRKFCAWYPADSIITPLLYFHIEDRADLFLNLTRAGLSSVQVESELYLLLEVARSYSQISTESRHITNQTSHLSHEVRYGSVPPSCSHSWHCCQHGFMFSVAVS